MSSAKNFTDRRAVLFGRKADADYLVNRVAHFGVTTVVGRPKMGKTWLLEECGRRLSENGYLVGYHECLGGHDQILYVVSDLYARWLLSAGVIEQAHSLWARHKDSFVSQTGQAVGSIFEKFAATSGKATEGVGKLVRETFQRLASANVDLKTGGLSTVIPLPYDQAAELIQILMKVSGGNRLVLIMDAWEQSTSLDGEKKVLDKYLKHSDDWPNCHILLGVRHPELDNADLSSRGWKAVSDLRKSSPQAGVHDLGPMTLDEDQEKQRLAAYVRAQVY